MKAKLILGSLIALSMVSRATSVKGLPPDTLPQPCKYQGAELIYNGDFTLGNTGFTSYYTSSTGCAVIGNNLQGNGTNGTYNINQINSCYGVTDRLGGNGNVLHFPDILNTDAGQNFWKQTVSVLPNKTYNLSLWAYEPNGNCGVQAVGTKFDVYINGVLVLNDNVGGCAAWNNKFYSWSSGTSTSAVIEIKNGTGNYTSGNNGMDLVLDGISFKQCLPPPPCENQGQELVTNGEFNSGSSGFTSYYTSSPGCASISNNLQGNGTNGTYNINQINTCYGVNDRVGGNGYVLHFPDILNTDAGQNFWKQTVGVTAGRTYNFSFWVYEPNGNCGVQPQGTNFDVYINGVLIQSDNVGGCSSWNNKYYSWYSGTSTSAILEIKNGAGNYTSGNTGMDLVLDGISLKECLPISCENQGPDLIVNGNFSSGSTGFTSYYTSSTGCAAIGNNLQGNGTNGTYNINQINTCYGVNDRVGGNGYVLHFPDILNSDAGQNFWKQTVSIAAGKTYNLSLWAYEPNGNCGVQPLGTKFEIYINGALIQTDNVGGCASWNNKNYAWYAGSSTSAVIEIRNGTGNYTSGRTGMDLVLDDISFRECMRSNPGDPTQRSGISALSSPQNSKPELLIMPNPSNGNAIIRSSVDMNVKVINELGQVVRTLNLNERNNYTERLENLNEGIYFINSYSKDGLIQKKLIITN